MKRERGEFLVTVTGRFDAAHRLRLAGAPCERLHGHGWRIEASFTGPLGADGIVRDFVALERELEERVISALDHRDLNELFEKPTTELIARWIWDRLAPTLPGLSAIVIRETCTSGCRYTGPLKTA